MKYHIWKQFSEMLSLRRLAAWKRLRLTDIEISKPLEQSWGQSSQCIDGLSETHLAECCCKHIFLIWSPYTILYFSDFNLKRAKKSNISGSSLQEMSEPSYGVFRRARCVANRKPLSVIMQFLIGGGKYVILLYSDFTYFDL